MELFFILYSIIFGLFIGSFLNVIIDRIPAGESFYLGRSHCDKCRKTLEWYELIPLLSFIIQRRRCRKCQSLLSFQYPLLELATGICFGVVTFFQLQIGFGSLPALILTILMAMVIVSDLIVIFMIDLKHQLIYDHTILIALISTFTYLYFSGLNPIEPIRILSACLTFIFFWLLFFLTRGTSMGFGDVELSLVMGYISGFPGVIFSLYGAFLTGAFCGVILILAKNKSLKSKIAFGPFLIIGLGIWSCLSPYFLNWWHHFI